MSEHLRSPLGDNLAAFVQAATDSAAQLAGLSLPCTVKSVQGLLVTVNFEVTSTFTFPTVTVPVAMYQYATMPVQVGDKGFVVAADALLGVMSGLSSAKTVGLGQPSNLGALVFVPLSNTAWTTPDGNAVVLTGVGSSGVVLRSGNLSVKLTLNGSGVDIELSGGTLTIKSGTITANNCNVNVDSGTITVMGGDVIADGISLKTHIHPDPQGGVTGPPIP